MSSGISSPSENITGYNVRNIQQFNPQMMQIFEKLMSSLQSGGGLEGGVDFLSRLAGGEEGAFKEAEAPAYSSFDKMLGQIGSRYSQLGARDSSSFQQAISGGAAQLSENLGAKRLEIRSSAIDRLLGLSNDILNKKPTETVLDPKPDFMKLIGQILPVLLQLFAGGGAGGAAGAATAAAAA